MAGFGAGGVGGAAGMGQADLTARGQGAPSLARFLIQQPAAFGGGQERQATAYDAVHTSGEAVYWLETRPSQDGRAVVVRWTDDAGAADAVPAGFDVGSRVHEYGGGAYLPAGRTLFACSRGDQRLYRIDGQRDPVPITPEPLTPASLRYGDLRLVSSGALLVCVRERHQGEDVVNELVALPVDGSADPWVVASGHDFCAAPVPAPMVAALPG